MGIGKEAVKHFVCLNAESVIDDFRQIAKGETAKEEIEIAKIETIQHGILSEMGLQGCSEIVVVSVRTEGPEQTRKPPS